MKNISLILSLIIVMLWGCTPSKKQENQLIIFHAGSVSAPLKEIIEEYRKQNPNITILTEAAGSVESARKITDLKKECDIMISADYSVIQKLLIPDYTSWHIPFASNEMTLVYTEKSKKSSEINLKNWKAIISNEDILVGRSDPNSDPCGYRTLLTLQLANNLKKEGFYKNIAEKSAKNIRPKETDLIALLETGAVDYIFLYKSVAKQHNFKYLELPDSINLKHIQLNDWYKKASTDIKGKKPGQFDTKHGEAMIYAITILKASKKQALAQQFAEFFLTQGNKIFEKQGQPSVIPSKVGFQESMPTLLQKYTIK